MANPIVTSLPAYVEQQRLPLIAKSVLGAKSASLLTLQTGVKGPTAINLVSTDVEFGDGKACGWASKGSTSLTQRTITPAILKVNTEFCDGNLIGKWAQSQVRIAAGVQNLPFEEEVTNGLIAGCYREDEMAGRFRERRGQGRGRWTLEDPQRRGISSKGNRSRWN